MAYPASLKAGHGYSSRKRKPCKYSIKKLKVTGVTSSHHPTVSGIAANKGFLDLIKFREKNRKSIRGADARGDLLAKVRKTVLWRHRKPDMVTSIEKGSLTNTALKN